MRRTLALLVVATLAVGCSDAERPPIERVSGTIEPSGGSDAGNGSVGEDAAPGGPGGGTTGGDPGTTGASGGATAGSADGPNEVAGATAALDAYLDALEAQDFKAAERASTGGARFMATIRDVVARYNAERDGVTKLSYSARSFTVASADRNRVAFAGSATLDSTTSGPAGSPRSDSSTFTDPHVTFSEGGWRVADFGFDGAPIAYFPASSRKEVGGVDLQLRGGLSFGTSTALVIDLITEENHGIRVDGQRLTYEDGTTAESTVGALIFKRPAALYFLFDRVTAAPASWSATVTVDGDTKNETSANVVLRFG